MKFYFAPLEGISGYIYRNVYQQFYPHIDKYFTPFISPNQNRALSPKDVRDIHPENNKGMYVVPQILTNNAEYFIHAAKELKEHYGYEEVNLNIGCPSQTVCAKGKGAGFLAKQSELDVFLDEIFTKTDANISLKTRIGSESPEEFYELIEIFNKYPLHELIIHPRVRIDSYNNKPNHKIFADAVRLSKSKLCYNGDIFKQQDYHTVCEQFPELEAVMLGRGLLMNAGLVEELRGIGVPDKQRLKQFHDKLYADYQVVLSGDKTVLFKMKELWFYMGTAFLNSEKYMKKIKKVSKLCEYEEIVRQLFEV